VNASFAYLDASAAVKLILDEKESDALRTWLGGWPRRLSSELLTIELTRAIRRESPNRIALLDRVLAQLFLRPIADEVVILSGLVEPSRLKTLDAIHLATAIMVRESVGRFVTYDSRLAEAATGLGLPVASPA